MTWQNPYHYRQSEGKVGCKNAKCTYLGWIGLTDVGQSPEEGFGAAGDSLGDDLGTGFLGGTGHDTDKALPEVKAV